MGTTDIILNEFKLSAEARSPIDIQMSRGMGFIKLLAKLGFKKGAEVGVEKGFFAEALCAGIPDLKLYCIDAWTTYQGWYDYTTQSKLDEIYNETKQRLVNYDCKIIKGFSMDVVKTFEDESLDFVYIDAAHDFQSVTNDICEWTKKVRKGGIISGHDFRRHKGTFICHVKDVVGAYAYAYKIRPWFVLRGDKDPTWLWEKI